MNFLFLFVLSVFILQAQVPPYIPYQAIARDGSGQVKINTPIQVEFKIFNTMVSSVTAYNEVHSVTTNDFGYFNLRIGAGVIQSGNFSAINWQTGDVSYEVWVDIGLGFTQLGGKSGFLSVPYAMYAANSNPNPTLTINAPNTISNPSSANYSITIASPTLSIVSDQLSLSNGNTVTIPTTTINQGSYINVNGTSPNYTISAVTPTLTTTGNVNINGAYPNQTIDVPVQTLSITNNTINLSQGGGSITLPLTPSTNIVEGTNIAVSGISPNYTISAVTPTLTTTGNVNINGAYPTQTISVTSQSLSISGNTISLSANGGSVTLPSTPATTITQGTNVIVTGTSPNYTIASITPSLTATGNATLSGAYPTQTISVATQTLSISGNTLSLSAGGGSVNIPTSWNSTGNAGTNATTNFIGTTDANALVVRTNNTERLRVTSTGSIGIGTAAPSANFDINTGNVKLGVGSTPFSIIKCGTLTNSSLLSLGNNAGTITIAGAQVGDVVVVTLNSHNASAGSISLNNAFISAANTLSYNINTSLGLLVTLNFSYILMRP